MQNYYLVIEYEGEEVATLKAPLKEIDKLTTIFPSDDSLIEYLFDDERLMFDNKKARVKIKTPRNNYIDPLYSSFTSVVIDQDNEEYKNFIKNSIPMPLFKLLNDFYNDLVAKYAKIDKNKLVELNNNGVYLWDSLFNQKLQMSLIEEKTKNDYIYLKGTVDNLHLDNDLKASLNSLLKLKDISEDLEKRKQKKQDLLSKVNKISDESLKQERISEIENDKTLDEYSFETKTINDLRDKTIVSITNYNKNYRNYRDLYSKISPFFSNKEEKEKRFMESNEFPRTEFLEEKMNILKNDLVDKMFEDASSDVNLKPAEGLYESSYKEELENELEKAQNNNDEDEAERIREELTSYLNDGESMKLR